MKNKKYTFLSDLSLESVLFKTYIIFVTIFFGCIYNPFMFLGFLLAVCFMAFENNIKSIYLIFSFYPFFRVFKSELITFTFWKILVVIFVLIHGIRFLYFVFTKKIRINCFAFALTVLLMVYMVLPIYKDYNILTIGKTYLWIVLGYLLYEMRRELDAKIVIMPFISAIMLSFLLSLLKPALPFLQELFPWFYAYSYKRFAGLMYNPNSFYELVVVGLFSLFYLLITKKVNYKLSVLFLPLIAIGWLTLSRTFFIVCLILVVLFIFISALQKETKQKMMGLVSLCCLVMVALIIYPYTVCYLTRMHGDSEQPTINASFNNDFTLQLNKESLTMNTSENNYQIPVNDNLDNDEINENNSDHSIVLKESSRLEIYKYYIKKITQQNAWAFGVGLSTAAIESNAINAHNTFLQCIYSIGIVGLVIILSIIFTALIPLLKKVNFRNFILLMVGFVAIVACFMVENHFLTDLGFLQVFFAFLCLIDFNNSNNKEKIYGTVYTQKNSLYLARKKQTAKTC